MSDYRSDRYERSDRFERERAAPVPQPSLTDAMELGFRRIVTGLVIAGALIGLGAYAGGSSGDEAPNYQVTTTADGRVIRLNTENGTLVSCPPQGRCSIIQRRSDGLLRDHEREEEEDRDQDEQPPQQALPEGDAPKSLPAPAAPQGETAPAAPGAPETAPRPAAPAQ